MKKHVKAFLDHEFVQKFFYLWQPQVMIQTKPEGFLFASRVKTTKITQKTYVGAKFMTTFLESFKSDNLYEDNSSSKSYARPRKKCWYLWDWWEFELNESLLWILKTRENSPQNSKALNKADFFFFGGGLNSLPGIQLQHLGSILCFLDENKESQAFEFH